MTQLATLLPSYAPTLASSTSSISGVLYGVLILLLWVIASGAIFYFIYTMPADENEVEDTPIVREKPKEESIEMALKVLNI